MVSKIILFAFVIGTVSAATWMSRLPKTPSELAHKKGCFVESIYDVITFGSSITPLGECVRISCSTSMMDYDSCGVVSTDDPKCTITGEDLSKPYPDCCPDIKCDLDNNIL